VITSSLPLESGPVRVGALDFSLQGALGALDQHQTTSGTFFGINGNTDIAAGQPMQPGFYSDVTHAPAGQAHGVTMVSAHYDDMGLVDPVIAQPSNEWDNNWAEPAFADEAWTPARPLSLQNASTGRGFMDTVRLQLGQYNGQTGEQRLYDGMSLGVYYSSSPDWTPPEVIYVGERVDPRGGVTIVKVRAWDLSGILGGMATFTTGDGEWHSQDLVHNTDTDRWIAQIPVTRNMLYFVQVVDNAGNVSVADNKGHYYEVSGHETYLPVVIKAQ
jgi:hypothetical protein